MIRAASGIESPLSPSTYPPPSQRSCEARTIAATRFQAGEAARMRSPIDDVLLDECPLFDVERARLVEHGVRDRELADVVEAGSERELLELGAGQPERLPDGDRSLDDLIDVVTQVGRALVERLQEHLVRRTAAGPLALLHVEPLVGNAQRVARRLGLLGQEDGAE